MVVWMHAPFWYGSTEGFVYEKSPFLNIDWAGKEQNGKVSKRETYVFVAQAID